jgi:hypothetical protein
MSEIIVSVYRRIEEGGFREGILFLDEINCVSETLTPALLGFLQYKSFGGHKLPEGWIIVAAGNPVKYNNAARDLDAVTLDRLKVINIEPDFEVWKQYAQSQGLHPLILSYLSLRNEHFYCMETEKRGRSFTTPRGWEDLSGTLLCFEALDIPIDGELFGQYLQHDEIAREFGIFFELNRELQQKYRIDKILETGAVIPELRTARFDERLCVVQFLLYRLNTLAAGWSAHETRQNSLGYFINGLEAGRGDFWDFASERVRARENALGVKKKLGLLRPGEEEAELLLMELIKSCLTRIRGENPETPVNRFRELAARGDAETEALGRNLEQGIRNCFAFLRDTFGKSQELVIFLTELQSVDAARRFMEGRLGDLYEQVQSLLDFRSEEEELRSKLRLQSE